MLPTVVLTTIGALAMQAVAQMIAVDIQGHAPALDVDLRVALSGLIGETRERANALGDITQLLVNLAGGQGRHGCLR